MFLLVPAHLGCPEQNPESCKTVVCVCVCALFLEFWFIMFVISVFEECISGTILYLHDVQVLYLIEAVDEYCIQSLPEFEGKKFQNAAKEGFKLDATDKAKERKEELEKEFEPLLKWMKDDALKDKVDNIYC